MTREALFQELNSIFREIFDDESIAIKETTTNTDIDDWDSLEHINLILAVEQSFGIKFSMDEITRMKNVGEMVDLIATRQQYSS